MKYIYKPSIHIIAESTINKDNAEAWIESLGFTNYTINEDKQDFYTIVILAAKSCYNSFSLGVNPNLTRIRENYTDIIDNILASGHGSVLEHFSLTVAINDISRVALAELNRHRVGMAISERSMRYVRPTNIHFYISKLLRESTPENLEARLLIAKHLEQTEELYHKLEEIYNIDNMSFQNKKKYTSMFRRILPMGICSGTVLTMNMRTLRHICTLRHTPEVEEELFLLVHMLFLILQERYTLFFKDFIQYTTSDGLVYYQPKHHKV